MNKKFITLLASAFVLGGSVSTVSAADPVYATSKDGSATPEIKSGQYYQLGTAADGIVLSMNAAGKVTFQDIEGTSLPNTLWKVDVVENGEATPSFIFTNVLTGKPLSFATDEAVGTKDYTYDADDAQAVAGSTLWKWHRSATIDGTFSTAGFTTTFKKDSVMTLASDGTLGVNDAVVAVKYQAGHEGTITAEISLMPIVPGAVVLTKDDLNSRLWTQATSGKMKLAFNKDVEGGSPAAINLFSNQEYTATGAVGFPFTAYNSSVATSNPLKNPITATELTNINRYEYELAVETFHKALAKAIIVAGDDTETNANRIHASAFISSVSANSGVTAAATTAYKPDASELVAAIDAVPYSATSTKLKAIEDKVKAAMIAYLKDQESLLYNNDPTYTYSSLFQFYEHLTSNHVANHILASSNTTVALIEADVKNVSTTTKSDYDTAIDNIKENATDNGWLSLKAKDGKYLMVDTAYITDQAGDKHLKFSNKTFADLKTKKNGASLSMTDTTRLDINGRYNFQFVYYPAQDSIVIRTAGYAKLSDDDNGTAKYFEDLELGNAINYEVPTTTTHSHSSATGNKEQNLVKIAVLANNHREVTVGSSEFETAGWYTINTRISGRGVAAESTLTSVPDGVYAISKTDAAGNVYYLAAPIKNTTSIADNGNEVEWIRLDSKESQNPMDMPAYQWVVLKGYTMASASKTSPISFTNREYPNMNYTSVQLNKNAGATYLSLLTSVTVGSTTLIATTDSLTFTPWLKKFLKTNILVTIISTKTNCKLLATHSDTTTLMQMISISLRTQKILS